MQVLILPRPVDIHCRSATRCTWLALVHILELLRVITGPQAAWGTSTPCCGFPGPRKYWQHSLTFLSLRLSVIFGSFDAQCVWVVVGWQLWAIQWVRPSETELFHYGWTPLSCLFTHRTACWDSGGHLIGTHWHIQRAQEKSQVDITSVLHQRSKFIQFNASFLLAFIIHEVGHPCHIVADSLAHGNGDRFTFWWTAALQIIRSDLQCRSSNHKLEKYNHDLYAMGHCDNLKKV